MRNYSIIAPRIKAGTSFRRTAAGRLVAPAARHLRPPAQPDALRRVPLPYPRAPEFQPDPYVDYGRFLTSQGGILLVYKDIDERLRHTLWRVTVWTAFTAVESWFLLNLSPVAERWIDVLALMVLAILNWVIVAKPVEIYRHLEIRPDCIIIDGEATFWRKHMEGGFPAFRPDKDGNQILCGIYGTRFVEYLTVRRFDEFDRAPEVLVAHLQDAMVQLWTRHAM